MIAGLVLTFLLVLLLPLTLRFVEENIEVFIFFMGILVALFSGSWSGSLFLQAAQDPLSITLAVFVTALALKWFHAQIDRFVDRLLKGSPFRVSVAGTVIVLGILSSIITAIIAALLLVVIVKAMRLDRLSAIRLVVYACFSIGLGACLTPVGEPLSTIAISKLNEDFFYLVELLGPTILPLIVLLGVMAAFSVKKPARFQLEEHHVHTVHESYEDVFVRAMKVYLFVMGLTLLGAGFKPIIDAYILGLDSGLLYWINMVSAILDNATLAAAEISPHMSPGKIEAVLLGLLISGGMLIPGNIPNIIAAGKIGITSKEWAKVGVPLGLVIMASMYIYLYWIN